MSQPDSPRDSVLDTLQDVNAFMERLTFTDQPVAAEDVPPVLPADQDVLVPRSFKVPQRLDAALARLAADRGISKSDLVRQYLEAAVAADLATEQGGEVLIPLADALRALTGLRQLPHTA